MNRGEMRTQLRRQLQEPVADQWTDADLNQALNNALIAVERVVLRVDPTAFLVTSTADLVANQTLYAPPADMWQGVDLAVKETPAGKFTVLSFVDDWRIRREEVSARAFARAGRYFQLSWLPPVSVTAGLQITYVPILAMSDDVSVPEVHLALHDAVPVWAQLALTRETGEARQAIAADLQQILEDVPNYYRRSAGESLQFTPDTITDYGGVGFGGLDG